MDKQLKQKKLSFFQNIRKNIYLRSKNKVNNYKKLPEYLKNDSDVIDAVVAEEPTMINDMPWGYVEKIVRVNPELLNAIQELDAKARLVEGKPILVKYLNENEVYNLVYQNSGDNKEFIKYLPAELQLKIISENIIYVDSKIGLDKIGRADYVELAEFSDEVVDRYLIAEEIKRRQDKNYTPELGTLSTAKKEMQLKALMLWNGYSSKVSPEILEEFVRDNPLLFNLLPENVRLEKIRANPSIVRRLTENEKNEYLSISSLGLSSREVGQNYYNPIYFDIAEFKSAEEAKSELIKKKYFTLGKSHNVDGIVKNRKFIWEIGKFDPDILELPVEAGRMSDKIDIIALLHRQAKENDANGAITQWFGENTDTDLLEKLSFVPLEVLRCVTNNSFVILDAIREGDFEEFENILNPRELELLRKDTKLKEILNTGVSIDRVWNFLNSSNTEMIKQLNRLSKILTNDDVMNQMSQEELLEYITNPTHEKLVGIIQKTYGEESAQILIDRPQITIEDIPNMYIFHPEIIKEFTPGAVHATLSFKTNAAAEFSELARNPDKMESYRKFANLTEGIFEDTAVDLDRKLIAYEYARDLLHDIEDTTIREEQKNNLYLAIMDVMGKKEQNVIPFPTTASELSTYSERRNDIYDGAISKMSEPEQIKQLMCQRFFRNGL